MTVTIGGTEVGYYETANTHRDAYYGDGPGGYSNEPGPQAQGLYDILGVFNSLGTTHATRVGVHYSTTEETYSLFIHNGADGSVGGNGQAKTTCVRLGTKIQAGGYVFDRGQGIATGTHGQHSYVYVSGDPLTDDGTSDLVFESGTGLNWANVTTLVEDDAEDPNSTGDFADSYDTTENDAVAQHGYGLAASDGVVWPITGGTYSFDIRRGQVDDGRTLSTTDYPLPDAWIAAGPGGIAQVGGGGSGTITIDLDLP